MLMVLGMSGEGPEDYSKYSLGTFDADDAFVLLMDYTTANEFFVEFTSDMEQAALDAAERYFEEFSYFYDSDHPDWP